MEKSAQEYREFIAMIIETIEDKELLAHIATVAMYAYKAQE